jgi:hypothetical protein
MNAACRSRFSVRRLGLLGLLGAVLSSAVPLAFAQADGGDRYGLQGVFRLSNTWRFCIVDEQTGEGTWVGLGETVGGYTVTDYDADTRWMSFRVGGESFQLRVAEMGAPDPLAAVPKAKAETMPTAKGIPAPRIGTGNLPPSAPPDATPPNFIPEAPPVAVLRAQAEANARGLPFSSATMASIMRQTPEPGGPPPEALQMLAESIVEPEVQDGLHDADDHLRNNPMPYGEDPPSETPDFTPPELSEEQKQLIAQLQAAHEALEAQEHIDDGP